MNLFYFLRTKGRYHLVFFLFMISCSIISVAQAEKENKKDKDDKDKGGKGKDTELSFFPNPAKAKSKIQLTMVKDDIVTLDMLDSEGKFVERIYDRKPFAKGRQTVERSRNKNSRETYTFILYSQNSGKHTDYLIFEEIKDEDKPTAITTSEYVKGFLVGPNPTSSVIEINSPGRPVTGLIIHDMIGNAILNEKVDFQELHKIDLSHLHSGIYFLTLKRRDEIDIVRIVKTE